MPCCAGARPVAIDVSAVDVVDGTTVVIAVPSMAASSGRVDGRASTSLAPRPSSTSSTTLFAPRTASGIQGASRPPTSAGIRPATDAPSSAGNTGSGSIARRLNGRPGAEVDPGYTVACSLVAALRFAVVLGLNAHLLRLLYDVAVKVSTRSDYAARALLSLALHGEERPTSVKEIAERTGLPQPYLEQILLSVKGAGLVRSKRGVGGGYVLARTPPRSRWPTSSPRSTARNPRWSTTTITAKATACSRRCGSSSPRRRARCSTVSPSPTSSPHARRPPPGVI